MEIDCSAWSLRLPRGAAVRLRKARGVTVRGTQGRVWLTEEGSAEDVFLAGGDSHVIGNDGRVVIEADGDEVSLVLEAAGRRLPAVRLR